MQNDTRICVAIGASHVDRAAEMAEQESAHADVLEIRLDYFSNPEDWFSAPRVSVPLLFTNRPDWEGGYWKGSEQQRVDLLLEAVESDTAAYIDCELRARESTRECLKAAAQKAPTQLILSWHDFDLTPPEPELQQIVRDMQSSGADIGKIITTPRNHLDVLRVLKLQELASELMFPLIAFCMGRQGMISRLATLELGGFMTYCAPRGAEATAAGQMGAAEMRELRTRFQR